ncbi:hypothetical protein [Shewanella scandinavica]|uniref:Uncharacterized protein n=1 Tax=Shewanella scandinavica TaxID=3063538 RepID=A0ABU3G4H0_9GAMM|nr:hypothetical protein [Shewanella sp. SP2S1-2]MDT3282531.1 hypothetical protein [Shewanella sp. SP2S1-2]
MKLTKNHKQSLYFHNLFESKPLEAISGRDDLNNIVSEFVRLKSLIPLQRPETGIRTAGVQRPKCYVTTFAHAYGQLERVQNARTVVECLEDKLINFPGSTVITRECVQALHQAHEGYCRAMNHLHLLIGEHNCTVNNTDFIEAGYKKIKLEYLKSTYAYQDKYQPALATLAMILSDFYSQDANLPYKPERVIDAIEDLYNENAPPHLSPDPNGKDSIFPKDRKSKFFSEVVKSSLLDVPKQFEWSGRTKEEHKHIDMKSFYKKYISYCIYPDAR